jgi:hypothetical protein
VTKRGKNWSEDETTAFISIWSEHFDRLMSAGSRNTPIYHAMADEFNAMQATRVLSGGDVKCKIGNLLTEYRKKKKEQGKTGASPSPWPYFDMLDKLLGKSQHFYF